MQDQKYNNIFNKKNIEFTLDGIQDRLPYKDDLDVKLKANQIIFTSINNIFQRLLDNDLYNEAVLKKYVEYGLIGGPTYVSSINQVEDTSFLNKKFVVSGENGISVLRKEEVDVSDTLSGRYLDGTKVNYVTLINERYVACTKNGIYESLDKINWTRRVGNDGIDVVDMTYNQNFLNDTVISAYDYIAVANKGKNIVFYGHDGTNGAWKDFSTLPELSAISIKETTATSIFSFEGDSALYVGTNAHGLLASKLQTANDDFSAELGTAGWTIYDMAEIPYTNKYENYMLATDYGVKQSRKKYGFKNFTTLPASNLYIYDAFKESNVIYVATGEGLRIIDTHDQSLSWNNTLKGNPCYSIAKSGGSIYVGTQNGVYRLVSRNDAVKIGLDGKAIQKIASFNDAIFAYVQSDNEIVYSKTNSAFSTLSNVVDLAADEFVRQFVVNGGILYIVTNKKVYAVIDGSANEFFLWADTFAGNNNVYFAQNLPNGKIAVQVDNKICILNGSVAVGSANDYAAFSSDLSDKVVTDIAVNDNNELFLLINGFLYRMFKTDLTEQFVLDQVIVDEKPVKANKIGFFRSSYSGFTGLVLLDGRKLKFLQYDERFGALFPISIVDDFKDILIFENGIYALAYDGESISRFGVEQQIVLQEVEQFLEHDGVSVKQYEGNFGIVENRVSMGKAYLSTFSDHIGIETYANSDATITADIDEYDGIRCSDFVGYANNGDEKKTILLGKEDGIDVLNVEFSDALTSIESVENVATINAPVSVNTFADICYREESTGLITNALNFAAGQDGLYALSAKLMLAKESIPVEISEINAVGTLSSGETIIGTNSGAYVLDTSERTNFRNVNYGLPIKTLSKHGDLLVGSGNGQDVLIAAEVTADQDILWHPLFDSIDSTEFAITGYSQEEATAFYETTAFFDLSSDCGYVLDVSPKTISREDQNSSFDGLHECILTGDISVNDLSSIYKDNDVIKAVDISGNVYDLTINQSTGDVTITATFDPDAEPKTLNEILLEKLANFYKIEDDLSIGNDISNPDIIKPLVSELPDEVTVITAYLSDEIEYANINVPLTTTTISIPEWNTYSSLCCNDPKLSISFDFTDGQITSLSVIPYIQVSALVFDSEETSAVLTCYTLSANANITEQASSFVLIDSDSSFMSAVYENDVVSGNVLYKAGLFVENVEYAPGYDATSASIGFSCYLSSTLGNSRTFNRLLPTIQETNDGLYYDSVYNYDSYLDERGHEIIYKSYYSGYCISSDNPSLWLLFTGEALCAFDAFNVGNKNETLGFTQIASSISNDNFNDVYYFRVGDNFEFYPIRKTLISNHDKDFFKAKYSTVAGDIVSLTLEGDNLYVVKPNSVFYTSKNTFPAFQQVGFPSDAGDFKEMDSCSAYSLIAFEELSAVNVFRYESGQQIGASLVFSDDETCGSFESFFHDDSNVYIETNNGIWRLNGNTLEKVSDFIKQDNVKAIGEDFVIGDAYLYLKEKLYDFKNGGYVRLPGDTINEEIVDIKVRNGDTSQPLLYVATKDSVYKYEFDDLSSGTDYTVTKINNGVPFSNVKGIYFTNDSSQSFYVIDGIDLYVYDSFSDDKQLSDCSEVKYEGFLSGNFTDKISINDFKELLPAIVKKDSLNELALAKKIVKQVVKDIPKAIRFIDNGTSNKYVYSSTALSGITPASDSSDFSLSLKGRYGKNIIRSKEAIVDKTGTKLWGFAKVDEAIKVKEISLNEENALESKTYDVFGNPSLSALLFDSANVVYAAASGGGAGLYKSGIINGYKLDDGNRVVLCADSLNTDKDEIFSLAFLKNDYVLNYLHKDEIDGSDIQISMFASSNEDIAQYLQSNYISNVGAPVLSPLFNRYLFISDGGNGYVYDYHLKQGRDLPLHQLEQAANGLATLMFLKESSGLGLLGYGNVFGTFDGFSDVKMFSDVDASKYMALANNFKRGTKKLTVLNEKPDFLIGTTYGLKYVYDSIMTRSFYNKDNAIAIDKSVGAIEKVLDVSSNDFYIVGAENVLYEVTGLKTATFRKIYEFDPDETVLDIFSVQKNEYLIATTKGIYTTSLSYKLTNDLKRFTIDNIYEIINDELKNIIADHIEKEHKPSSIITQVNAKADNKLSFLLNEDKHKDIFVPSFANSVRVVKDDIIDTIVRGGESPNDDSYVKVGIKNWAVGSLNPMSTYTNDGFINAFTDANSGKTFDISVVPYIVKNWKSGLKEIYIYVPSTGTYYANNPQGMSNSQYSYNAYQRDNVPNSSLLNTLPSACTTLRVYLYNSYFKIKTILAAQCTGNSLPLKIYKDNVNADDAWKGVFDTVIQPSALRTLPMTIDSDVNNVRICTDELERIFLDFSIYGTDAQAIRIIAES